MCPQSDWHADEIGTGVEHTSLSERALHQGGRPDARKEKSETLRALNARVKASHINVPGWPVRYVVGWGTRKNSSTAFVTVSTCSRLSSGYIGNDTISSARRSVRGKLPRL